MTIAHLKAFLGTLPDDAPVRGMTIEGHCVMVDAFFGYGVVREPNEPGPLPHSEALFFQESDSVPLDLAYPTLMGSAAPLRKP